MRKWIVVAAAACLLSRTASAGPVEEDTVAGFESLCLASGADAAKTVAQIQSLGGKKLPAALARAALDGPEGSVYLLLGGAKEPLVVMLTKQGACTVEQMTLDGRVAEQTFVVMDKPTLVNAANVGADRLDTYTLTFNHVGFAVEVRTSRLPSIKGATLTAVSEAVLRKKNPDLPAWPK